MPQFKKTSFTDTIVNLQAQGYYYDFTLTNNQLMCAQPHIILSNSEFQTIEMHYFPCEDQIFCEKMLYAIYVPAYFIKGRLLITGIDNNIQFLKRTQKKQDEEVPRSMAYMMSEIFNNSDFNY